MKPDKIRRIDKDVWPSGWQFEEIIYDIKLLCLDDECATPWYHVTVLSYVRVRRGPIVETTIGCGFCD